MQVVTNAVDAAKIILAAQKRGELGNQGNGTGGSYYAIDEETSKIHRCAIGQLFSPEEARKLQTGEDGYLMAGMLMERGVLEVPEHQAEWFSRVQNAHDLSGDMTSTSVCDQYTRDILDAQRERFQNLLENPPQ